MDFNTDLDFVVSKGKNLGFTLPSKSGVEFFTHNAAFFVSLFYLNFT